MSGKTIIWLTYQSVLYKCCFKEQINFKSFDVFWQDYKKNIIIYVYFYHGTNQLSKSVQCINTNIKPTASKQQKSQIFGIFDKSHRNTRLLWICWPIYVYKNLFCAIELCAELEKCSFWQAYRLFAVHKLISVGSPLPWQCNLIHTSHSHIPLIIFHIYMVYHPIASGGARISREWSSSNAGQIVEQFAAIKLAQACRQRSDSFPASCCWTLCRWCCYCRWRTKVLSEYKWGIGICGSPYETTTETKRNERIDRAGQSDVLVGAKPPRPPPQKHPLWAA